jgi:hypothetical protein
MGSMNSNTMEFFANRADAAIYVTRHLIETDNDFVWTMIIEPVKSGGYCVHTAIGTSLENTGKTRLISTNGPPSTSDKEPDSSFQKLGLNVASVDQKGW